MQRAAVPATNAASQARETRRLRTLARRMVSVPAFAAAAFVALAAAPFAFPVAAVVDAVRRRGMVLVRAYAMLCWYLVCECAGIVGSACLWAAVPRGSAAQQRRWVELHYGLQSLWARALWHGLRCTFSLQLRIDGDPRCGPQPFHLLVRHASLVDTLLPVVTIGGSDGVRLRYVLKSELLWDPCLDIVGHRLPNVFVRRGGETERAAAAIAALSSGVGEGEGVLIYPEGTRFTEAKRERALAKLAASGEAARVSRFERCAHVLPPRNAGVLAMLDARPDLDVLIFMHRGLEGAATFGDLWRGRLIGREVCVAVRRVPASSIPRDREGRCAWLDRQWEDVDAWVGSAAG